MFYRIKENIIFDYADYKYAEDCLETDIITQAELDADKRKVIIQDGILVLNPNYEEEKEAEKEAEFNHQFFHTTLGYVRRNVTMKDGSVKSFLTDILPMLVVGVPILVYDRELNQTRVQVTEVFINECKQQLYKDFYGNEGQ